MNLKLVIKNLKQNFRIAILENTIREQKNRINDLLELNKEQTENFNEISVIKEMYKKALRKDHNELIKLKNDYKILAEDYSKQTKKLDKLEKKVGK